MAKRIDAAILQPPARFTPSAWSRLNGAGERASNAGLRGPSLGGAQPGRLARAGPGNDARKSSHLKRGWPLPARMVPPDGFHPAGHIAFHPSTRPWPLPSYPSRRRGLQATPSPRAPPARAQYRPIGNRDTKICRGDADALQERLFRRPRSCEERPAISLPGKGACR